MIKSLVTNEAADKKACEGTGKFTKGKLSNPSKVKVSYRGYSPGNANKAHSPDAGATPTLQSTFHM